ncbi:T9SS C-terminal target domain-containing protein, partial [Bacteroidetes/Chlorobi group bacterium ChocPot_Mid]
IPTKSALIRIRQSFSATQPTLLKIDNTPVSKLAFNYDGSVLLAANDAGTITAWNTVTEKSIKNFNLTQPNYPATQIRVTGMAFTRSDSIFAIAFYWLNDYPRKDSIAFFNYSQEFPFLRTAIEQGFNTKNARFDNKKQFIAFIPDIGMKVKIYSANDGTFIKDLAFDKPITSFVFNRDLDQAAVSLMDGTIKILHLPDFTVTDSIDYSDFPLILDMSVASNGKFIALASKAPYITMFSDNRNDICVVNIPSKQVIRRLRRTASDPVGLEFSPISTKLLVGSLADPQISYWDLPVDVSFNSFKGHTGKLTDFAFSPRGSMIATSSASSDNLYLRRFSYAESDESDSSFTIITPSVNIVDLQLTPAFISETVSYNLPAAICVKSDSPVPLSIDSVGLKNGIHFSLKSPLPKDTNIFAGQCIQINLNYTPLDTGEISDSVIIYSCGSSYYLPIHSRGKMRNIRLLSKKFMFDPTCVGSAVEKTFAIAINDDPVPLTINKHEFIQEEYNPFISLTNRDMVYQPGDTIFASIKFEPLRLGIQTRKLLITHSNLSKFSFQIDISGEGIGTNYELSHYDLRFIPEILTRNVAIINNSDNTIFIYDTIIDPIGYFSVKSQLPINIKPHSESEIIISWNSWLGEPPSDVNLKLIAGPCAAEKNITLGLYKGSSNITIPDVFADPKDKTTINIDFINDENHPYNGQRFFEAEITMNPRLFLPQNVTSKYGNGFLIRNDILNDRRIIGFRVEGDFPTSGRLAEIHGIAGLAEIDTSHIRFNKSQLLWGKSVSTKTSPSIFNLINICGSRLVIHGNKISNLEISPNPANGEINIEYFTTASGSAIIEVLNNLGEIIYKSENISISEGINNNFLNLSHLRTGTYNLLIKFEDSFVIAKLLILY